MFWIQNDNNDFEEASFPINLIYQINGMIYHKFVVYNVFFIYIYIHGLSKIMFLLIIIFEASLSCHMSQKGCEIYYTIMKLTQGTMLISKENTRITRFKVTSTRLFMSEVPDSRELIFSYNRYLNDESLWSLQRTL